MNGRFRPGMIEYRNRIQAGNRKATVLKKRYFPDNTERLGPVLMAGSARKTGWWFQKIGVLISCPHVFASIQIDLVLVYRICDAKKINFAGYSW